LRDGQRAALCAGRAAQPHLALGWHLQSLELAEPVAGQPRLPAGRWLWHLAAPVRGAAAGAGAGRAAAGTAPGRGWAAPGTAGGAGQPGGRAGAGGALAPSGVIPAAGGAAVDLRWPLAAGLPAAGTALCPLGAGGYRAGAGLPGGRRRCNVEPAGRLAAGAPLSILHYPLEHVVSVGGGAPAAAAGMAHAGGRAGAAAAALPPARPAPGAPAPAEAGSPDRIGFIALLWLAEVALLAMAGLAAAALVIRARLSARARFWLASALAVALPAAAALGRRLAVPPSPESLHAFVPLPPHGAQALDVAQQAVVLLGLVVVGLRARSARAFCAGAALVTLLDLSLAGARYAADSEV